MYLITDRTQQNVARRNLLAAKGTLGMTEAEYAEWTGDPLLSDRYEHSEAVNLLSVGAFPKTKDTILPVGAAEYFEGKDITLSARIGNTNGGTPLLQFYWYDLGGQDAIPGVLSEAGSITINTGANTNNRQILALFVSANVEYQDVMLEFGTVAHDYVPYTPIIPTNTTKGAYNYTDLNRVESTVEYLAGILGVNLTVKTDWAEWDIPSSADMTRYLENIRALRGVYDTWAGTPEVPRGMNKLTYAGANDIEKILLSLERRLDSSWWCGEVFCGEV